MAAYTYSTTSNENMGVSSSGSAAPSIVYSYTTATEDIIVENDYLSITQVNNVSIDFGNITSPGDIAFDYKYVTPDFNDQNKFKTYGGSSSVLFARIFEGSGLIKIGEYVPPVFVWIGSGTLFEMGGDITRMVAPGITGPPIVSSTTRIYTGSGNVEYNISSGKSRNYTYDFGVSFDDTSFITRNYGLLESPHSTAFDYGSIDNFSSLAYEDYRYIDYIPVFGKLSIEGFANPVNKVYSAVASGTLFEVGSVTETILYQEQSDTNTSLFTIFGSATIDKNLLPTIRSYTGFGDLFNVGSKIESATYTYNSSSIVGYTEVDYQSITTSGTTANYGSIIDEVSEQYNYGSIVNVGIAKPYGSAFVTGFVVDNSVRSFIGSGAISNINGSAQAVVYDTPEETALFNISGGYSSAYLVRSYIASGDVKTVNSSENRNAYNYDINAVSSYINEDFGAITASGTTANYGSVTVGSSAEKNYGYVIDTNFVYPFGTLTLSGNFSPKLRNSFFGSGSATVYGSASVVFTEPTPQVYRDIETVLFNVSGAATTVFQRGAIYSGSGSLFNISGSTSSRTWSYTFGSVVEFSTENYGFVTASGTTVNYGLVSDDSDAESDYGYVFNRQTEYPYRGLATLQGQSTTIFNLRPSVIGSGSLFAINGAADTSAFVGNVFDSTDLFKVTGDAIALRSPKYDASGAYKALSGSTNTTTYSYNFSASQSYTEGDYGSITASGTTVNYGLVSEGSSVGFDYGYIIDNEILKTPFGSIFISGAFSNLKLTDAYAGSGSINVSGNAALVFAEPSPQIYVDKDPVLFFVTGNANVEFYRRPSFVGTGRISTLNGSASSRVFTYTEQSINPYSTTNYGFITASGTTVNYGLITNSSSSEFDYGYVIDRDIQYPYGTLQVSAIGGTARSRVVSGEGSIFAIKGSADSASFVEKSIESTELFTLSGASTNIRVYSEIGSGSIKTAIGTADSATYHYNTSSINLFGSTDFGSITTSGTTVNYGLISAGSSVEFDYGYVFDTISIYPFGILNVRGNATTDLDTAPSYVGSGSLFVFNGSVDTLVPAIKTDTETSLFTISGSVSESYRPAYRGSGSIFNNGISGESASFSYNESSTYADGFAQTYTTEDFGFITASGTTENYGSITVGSSAELDYGTIVIGTVIVPFGNLTIGGGISNFRRTFGFAGSGSINSSGAAGVVFAEPTPQVYVDREIALFRAYGDATTVFNRRPTYAGSGSLFSISESASSVTYNYSFTSIEEFDTLNLGTITVSGTTVNYGSITTGSTGDIDYGYVIIRETEFPYRGKVDVYGSATVQFNRVPSYNASGSLFATGGSALVFSLFGRKDLESTDLYAVYGDAETHFVPSYQASGSFRTVNTPPDTVSYSYNNTSIVDYGTLDLGAITTSGITANYGSVIEGSSAEFDYGEIKDTTIVYPFGSLNVSGSSPSVRLLGVSIPATGSLFAVGGEADSRAIIVRTDTETTNLFNVSGEAIVQVASAYDQFSTITSGSLLAGGYIEERASYHYNDSSKNLYNQFNYQSVSTSATTTSDYGLITNQTSSEFDYRYIDQDQSLYAFGPFNVRGESKSSFLPTLNFRGSGRIDVYGECDLIVILTAKKEPESTDLYEVSGSANAAVVRPVPQDKGYITLLSGAAESVTYIYNDTVVNELSNIDLGFITASGSTVDYGSVIIPSSSGSDYGSIVFTTTTYPYGSLYYSGAATTQFQLGPIYLGSGSINVSGSASVLRLQAAETTDLFKVFGEAGVPFIRSYAATGSLFNIGEKIETVSFAYNSSSVSEFVSADYQSVSSVAGIAENYGFINDQSSVDLVYGLITDTTTLYPFGTLNVSGSADVIAYQVYSQVGSGSINVSGSASVLRLQAAETTDLFKVFGEAGVPFSRIYTASGSLFNIGDKIESVTYSYNSSSEISFNSLDYEFITASGIAENYGSIVDQINNGEDYGSIDVVDPIKPYGSIRFAGESIAIRAQAPYQGSGSLFATGGSAETRLFAEIGTDLFKVSGDGNAPFGRSYVATGSLFNIGDKIESVTYSYNSSSEIPFDNLDYQFVTASGTTENYGSIADSSNSAEDYGTITLIDPIKPYGSITFVGESIAVRAPAPYQGSGSLFATGGSAETKTIIIPTETQLFRISGAATNLQVSFGYIASGSLFNIGDKIESVTYSYNSSSEISFNSLDYEFITASGITQDYGFISDSLSSAEDYGLISIVDPIKPYGSITFNGEANVVRIPAPYQGSGSLFATGGRADARVVITPTETQLFRISGAATNLQVSFGYATTGSLFNIGTLEERVSYSYNTSSATNFESNDYEFVSSLAGITSDYGFIGDSASDIDDYGSISITAQQIPFGNINITGGSEEVFKPILAWKGTGNINIYGEVLVGFSLSGKAIAGSTDLFTISGSALSSRPFVAIAGGSLFTIGDREERASYSYNTSSIVEGDTRDYEFITSSGVTIDYGNILDPLDAGIDDYGYIVNLEYSYPFGTLSLSGDSAETRARAFEGTGSLFAIGGEGDSYSRIAVTETQLFVVSGNASTPRTRVFVGVGSLFGFNGLVESVAVSPDEETTGLFRISGSAIEKNTERYIGSGDAITLQTGIYPEYLYYRPVPRYVNSIYGPIGGDISISGGILQKATNFYIGLGAISVSGQSAEKNTERYIGSGTEFISGTSRERFMPVHIGTGSLFSIGGISEATTKVVPSETRLFKVSGAAAETHTEVYNGTGTEFVSGDSTTSKSNIHIGSGSLFAFNSGTEIVAVVPTTTGLFTVIGQATEAFGRATYEGSGSLFTQNGIAESRTYIAPTETCLFRVSSATTESVTSTNVGSGTEFVSGSSINSFIPRYFGSGSLFAVGGESNAYARIASTETQLFNVTGSAEESRTNLYVGSGSLFAINSGTESIAIVPTTTGLYHIRGQATEARTQTQIGSGSLFAVGGASVAFSDAAATETQLFRIFGSASEAHTEFYSGFGAEFISGTAAERYLPTIIGSGSLFVSNSAKESSSVSVPTETQLFRISGSADIREVNTYIAGGTEFISGSLTENSRKSYVGSGSLFAISSTAESATIAVQAETQLFRIFGSALEKDTTSYIGSGFVTLAAGAAEIKTSVPTTETQLFRVSGSAAEVHTESYIGSGTEFISGGVQDSYTAIYVGTGTLRTVSGAAESTTLSIPTETQLFRVSGVATTAYNAVFTNVGSGQETISGSATEKNTENYVGKGSLFTFDSASIASTVIIPIQTNLFRISGRGADSYTRISIFEGGQINTSGQSADQRVEFTPARIFGTII